MNPGSQTPPGVIPGTSSLESLDAQMAAVVLAIIANIMALMVLQGFKERLTEQCPDKDYGYLTTFPKITTAIFVGLSAYYLYLTWRQKGRRPDNNWITWLVVANVLALGAALMKMYVAWEQPAASTGVVEETIR